jgi:hypothetical protein
MVECSGNGDRIFLFIAEFDNICCIQEIVQISHIHYFVLFNALLVW